MTLHNCTLNYTTLNQALKGELVKGWIDPLRIGAEAKIHKDCWTL